MRDAGRTVNKQAFEFPYFQELATPAFTRTALAPAKTCTRGDDFLTMDYSGSGDVTAPAGPGINDDGSGTSMDLELAKNLGKKGPYPKNHLRFLWVGAEEEGRLGSTYYATHLTDAQKLKIIAMLDFDMVASPNYARQVYDGDGSEGTNPAGPSRSGFIRRRERKDTGGVRHVRRHARRAA
jgi:Zn-dependent M28 family amino/carboxypeptidase